MLKVLKVSVQLSLLTAFVQLISPLKFSDVTRDVKLQDVSGHQIAAFADFNSDKATDILVLNSTGTTQSIYLWSTHHSEFIGIPLSLDIPTSHIAALKVADFDGDGLVDLLSLSDSVSDSDCLMLTVHWITLTGGIPEESGHTVISNKSSPLSLLMTFDVNGDHISDVLFTSCDWPQAVMVAISQGSGRNFSVSSLGGADEEDTSATYSSGYYLDLTNDCLPKLVLQRGGEKERKVLEVWTRKEGELVWLSRITLSFSGNFTISPLSFMDIDRDGASEAVTISCQTGRQLCTNVSVHVLKVSASQVTHCDSKSSFNLTLFKSTPLPSVVAIPEDALVSHPVLGDLNLDSYTDLLLQVVKDNNQSVVLPLVLLGRRDGSFAPIMDSTGYFHSDTYGSTKKVTLFDLWEDGILDVVVAHRKKDNRISLSAHRHSLSAGHTFLKVLVLGGHCYSNCASGTIPYGSVLTAASVAYSTTDRNGHNQQTRAVIRASTDPLQLPFILFGLGETPNFIAKLTVTAVVSSSSSHEHSGSPGTNVWLGTQEWRNLVPNSQVVVIPFPPDRPSRWRIDLYLTPSHLMYTTAGVLCGLAVGMAIIITLLQAREKYQDKQERKQAKHKFHFNAM